MKASKSDRAWAEAMGLSVEEYRKRFTPWKTRGKALPATPPASMRVVKSKPSPSTRARVIERDGHRCRYCASLVVPGALGPNGLTIDHVIPRSRGGTNVLDNLVVACRTCNAEKSHLLASEWQSPIPVSGIADIALSRMPTASCPDCTDGVWADSDERQCPTCEGLGILTVERAILLLLHSRNATRSERSKASEARTEVRRLRAIIEQELGPGSTRRDLVATLRRNADTIAQMSDAILRLKVQVAQLGGGELERMIPRPEQRERALRLVEDGAA